MRYTELVRLAWLYAIADRVSGRAYIGQAYDIKKRWVTHRLRAKAGQKHPLYAALRKRPDDLEFLILLHDRLDVIDRAERDLIVLANTLWPQGYNLKTGGRAAFEYADEVRERILAANRTPEVREKRRRANLGKKASRETRRRLSEAHRGQKRSPESTAKAAAKLRGRKRSAEAIEKTRLAQLGRRVSEEQKKQIAATLRGRKLSEEHKASIRAAHARPDVLAKTSVSIRGKKHTPETRARMSASKLGVPKSEETRARMRQAQQRRREREALTKVPLNGADSDQDRGLG